MFDCTLDPQNTCRYRPTPWDARALGLPTREIQHFSCTNETNGIRLLAKLDKLNQDEKIGLCFARIDSADHAARQAFAANGYRAVEQSYALSLNDLSAFLEGRFGRSLPLRERQPEDLRPLQKIAAESFHFGRFTEDPLIPLAYSQERQRGWIADMVRDSSITFRLLGPEGAPQGFHTYRRHEKKADMILSGVDDAFRPLAAMFWISCLADMAQTGIGQVETTISAANLPIVNLYAHLGFRFDKLWIGFHKHYTP